MSNPTQPQTLQDAIVYFADADNCLAYLVARRWPNGVVTCPTCGSENVSFLPSRRVWQCKTRHPRAQFSIKVGTIFEDSPIGLDKWLCAMWMIANCKNGVSSHEIARTIHVTQKSAWFMLHRIRLAMQGESDGKLGGSGGPVEADETFIGGKARNMHKGARKDRGRGAVGKAVVMGIVERQGEVRAMVVPNNKAVTVQAKIRAHVQSGASVFTDSLPSYRGLSPEFAHKMVDHAVSYVVGNVHTNCMENYWSLLKRGLHGTYVSVEPFHLFRYIDEQSFRYNNRKKGNDAVRFNAVLSKIVDRRITYKALTGKTAQAEAVK